MAKTNTGLVAYAKAQLGKPYWYGTFGYVASESLYNEKRKQYPERYKRENYNQGWTHQYGQRVHDCVGLIKGYLWSETSTSKPAYNASQDVSANGMLNICKTKGKINTIPEVPGVLVFYDGHVGVYEGKGYVIEARGHNYGVVRTRLADRKWVYWGYCPYITYIKVTTPEKPSVVEPSKAPNTTTPAKKSVSQIASDIIKGVGGWRNCNGEARKKKLESMGYNYSEVQVEINRQLKTPSKTNTNSKYYTKYTGESMNVDEVLKAIGVPSKYYGNWSRRKPIAKANGISAYVGSTKQNLRIINLAKQGKLVRV